jgi:Polyketide cyclase / dehydrase and lipid transport
MRIGFVSAAVAGLLAATPAFALEASKTVDVAASPEKVWQTIGDFCGIANWHPAIEKCVMGQQNGMPTRTLTLKGGGTILELQTGRNDSGMSYSYTILQSPLPVSDYHSTISVTKKGSGSEITWKGNFKAANGASDADATKAIQGIYDSGVASIAAKAKG